MDQDSKPELSPDARAVVLRIFIGESDRWKGKPLHEAIMLRARELGLAGCTVTRAIAGFGANSRIRTARILRLSMDLPIVMEIIDDEANVEAFLPAVKEMIRDGLVTVEPISVRYYRSGRAESR